MPRRTALHLLSCFLIASTALVQGASAQETLPHRFVEISVDSGLVRNSGEERAAAFSEVVRIEGATWIRLFFSEAELGQVPEQVGASVIRVTSLLDGAVQELDATALSQWQNSSAFFNGDAVRVEIVADPEAPASQLRIHEVMVGEAVVPGTESICGATDDRVLSSDPRAARIVPVGCTAWLIDDAEGCFLTAGHCVGASFSVVEFNVPLSSASGGLNHPAPEFQYPIDQSSVQWDQTVIGNDWAYFGAFPNAATELTPIEAQGSSYVLAAPPSPPAGETIRITGYGSVTGTQGTPLTWNQVQTTHTGPLVTVSGNLVRYATDTTGGNSGSAIFNEDNSTAIGIHTNAGCSAGGGSNQGTSVSNAGLQSALAIPLGICADGPPPLRIGLVTSPPSPVSPSGGSFQVSILDRAGSAAAINSANLVYSTGGADQTVALSSLGGGNYQAALPAIACGNEVTFRIDVESSGGTTVHHPFSPENSADRRYRRWIALGFDHAFSDNFETDQGWTVDNDGSLTDGAWERALPAGYGLRQDPPWDADSSGQAFLTNPGSGNTDVDGGATRLTSPSVDASGGADPHVSYWRWWDDGGTSDDTFLVEISNDDGGSWTTLETIGPGVTGAGWVRQTFRIADFLAPTSQMRLRFTAADVGAGNIVEAAVDGVGFYDTATGLACDVIFSDGFESGNTSLWSAVVP